MAFLLLNDRRTPHVVNGRKFQADIPVEVPDLQPYREALRLRELVVCDADGNVLPKPNLTPVPMPAASEPAPEVATEDAPSPEASADPATEPSEPKGKGKGKGKPTE